RHDGAGIVAHRRRRPDGPAVPNDLFRADQRRHLHQGAGLRRSLRRPSDPPRLRPGADALEPCPAARPGEVTAMRTLSTIYWLSTKELRSFFRDWVLFGLVIYSFSVAIIAQAQSNTQELRNASIAVVDEDRSELSRRIMRAFLPPY